MKTEREIARQIKTPGNAVNAFPGVLIYCLIFPVSSFRGVLPCRSVDLCFEGLIYDLKSPGLVSRSVLPYRSVGLCFRGRTLIFLNLPDGLSGAFFHAGQAAGAFRIVDMGEIVSHLDRACRTVLRAEPAPDTAGFAHVHDFFPAADRRAGDIDAR